MAGENEIIGTASASQIKVPSLPRHNSLLERNALNTILRDGKKDIDEKKKNDAKIIEEAKKNQEAVNKLDNYDITAEDKTSLSATIKKRLEEYRGGLINYNDALQVGNYVAEKIGEIKNKQTEFKKVKDVVDLILPQSLKKDKNDISKYLYEKKFPITEDSIANYYIDNKQNTPNSLNFIPDNAGVIGVSKFDSNNAKSEYKTTQNALNIYKNIDENKSLGDNDIDEIAVKNAYAKYTEKNPNKLNLILDLNKEESTAYNNAPSNQDKDAILYNHYKNRLRDQQKDIKLSKVSAQQKKVPTLKKLTNKDLDDDISQIISAEDIIETAPLFGSRTVSGSYIEVTKNKVGLITTLLSNGAIFPEKLRDKDIERFDEKDYESFINAQEDPSMKYVIRKIKESTRRFNINYYLDRRAYYLLLNRAEKDVIIDRIRDAEDNKKYYGGYDE